MLPSFYHSLLEKYLTPTQLLTLKMLVWLLQTQKEVRIERLATTLQLPILQSSRRRHIQRFLKIKALSILVLWFPIVKEVIARQITAGSQLVIALDRTQWKEYNVLMVSAIVQKRAFPIFWTLLDKHGASNSVEQQQVYRATALASLSPPEKSSTASGKKFRNSRLLPLPGRHLRSAISM